MAIIEKIVIKSVGRPEKEDIDHLSMWFCEVFDLGNKEDEIEPNILKEIIIKSNLGKGVTSKELNKDLEIPRSTVIYHLNRFIDVGLIIRKGRQYYLRSDDLKSTIEDMQAEMFREFNRVIDFAQRMDNILEVDFNGRGKKRKGR
ncbi:MAG: hypothetical protein QXD23_00635 [Candidatus Micrarchaeaceae archaeon]